MVIAFTCFDFVFDLTESWYLGPVRHLSDFAFRLRQQICMSASSTDAESQSSLKRRKLDYGSQEESQEPKVSVNGFLRVHYNMLRSLYEGPALNDATLEQIDMLVSQRDKIEALKRETGKWARVEEHAKQVEVEHAATVCTPTSPFSPAQQEPPLKQADGLIAKLIGDQARFVRKSHHGSKSDMRALLDTAQAEMEAARVALEGMIPNEQGTYPLSRDKGNEYLLCQTKKRLWKLLIDDVNTVI